MRGRSHHRDKGPISSSKVITLSWCLFLFLAERGLAVMEPFLA